MAPGKKIALVEQFTMGHCRGSSGGGSRLSRTGYHRSWYTALMKDALPIWKQLEVESNSRIFIPTGGLLFGPTTSTNLADCAVSMKKYNIPYSVLDADEANKRYPILNLPSSYKALLDHTGGVIRANFALKAYQGEFVKNGGVLLECCKVEKIVPGPSVKMYTSKGLITTKRLVITAGPWTSTLLEPTGLSLPLQVWRPNVLYWPVEDEKLSSPEQMPVFNLYRDDGHEYDMYGLPTSEYPGLVKICQHEGLVVDPDKRDLVPGVASLPAVTDFVRTHFKGVHPEPSIVETCLFTITPDHGFVLDRHPKHGNIVIGAGFSGHGFKLSPIVGKILSELALDLPLTYELAPYSIKRFAVQPKL